jgi:hypothetical protein
MVPAQSGDPNGNVWVVFKGDSMTGASSFWQALTSL